MRALFDQIAANSPQTSNALELHIRPELVAVEASCAVRTGRPHSHEHVKSRFRVFFGLNDLPSTHGLPLTMASRICALATPSCRFFRIRRSSKYSLLASSFCAHL
jgi:hypothetical protein